MNYLEYLVADLDASGLGCGPVGPYSAYEDGHGVTVLVAGQAKAEAMLVSLQLDHQYRVPQVGVFLLYLV